MAYIWASTDIQGKEYNRLSWLEKIQGLLGDYEALPAWFLSYGMI